MVECRARCPRTAHRPLATIDHSTESERLPQGERAAAARAAVPLPHAPPHAPPRPGATHRGALCSRAILPSLPHPPSLSPLFPWAKLLAIARDYGSRQADRPPCTAAPRGSHTVFLSECDKVVAEPLVRRDGLHMASHGLSSGLIKYDPVKECEGHRCARRKGKLPG
jgi:hypothetical protein